MARCLETLPLIDASFEAGEISYSKVRAMSRIATPENEDHLLMIARHGTASHVEKVVSRYKGVKCANEDRAEIDQHDARKLQYYQEDDGTWVIHARLPAEAGALVVKAIEAVASPLQAEQQELIIEQQKEKSENDVKNVSAETFSSATADTPADVTSGSRSDSTEQALGLDDPTELQNTYSQSRVDALVTMAEHFLANCDQYPQFRGLKGSERCQIMLHVDINTLRAQGSAHDDGNRCCNMDDKHWISAKTAKRLACDATLVTVLEDESGNVLSIGRRSRTVPTAIKRALSLRDITCRVPGCCQTRNLDAHHIKHWADAPGWRSIGGWRGCTASGFFTLTQDPA